MKTENKQIFTCERCRMTSENENEIKRCEEQHKFNDKLKKMDDCLEFELKEVHLKLFKELNIQWQDCEYGAPEIDPKRPYGNSDVEHDIKAITKLKMSNDRAYLLHREIKIALEIVLQIQSFQLGVYVRNDIYSNSIWKLKREAK